MRTLIAALITLLLPAVATAQTTGTRPGQVRVITTGTSATANTGDYNGWIVWRVTGTAAARTTNLPACNASANGVTIGVADGQGNASSGNISVAAPSGSSIVGPTTSITTDRGALEATCDGVSTWVVTATNNLAGTGGGGGVASITAGAGLTGGTIGSGESGTIAMPNVGNGPGSCTNCNISRDAQGRITAATSGSSGGGGGPAGEVAWKVVLPSGGDDTDNINNALATSSQGVILDGGVFNSCRTIYVPHSHVLSGTRTGLYYAGNGNSPWGAWPGTASVHCSNWSTSQYTGLDVNNRDDANPSSAMVNMGDNSVVEGFAIYGPQPGGGFEWLGQWSGGICLSGTSTQGARVRFMLLGFCRIGATFQGAGRFPLNHGGLAQEMEFTGNTFWWDSFDIVFGQDWPGNGSADWRVIDNEFAVPYAVAITCDVCTHGMIQNNRIEDANGGILLQRSSLIQVQGNFFNDMHWPMDLGGSRADTLWGISVMGNQGQSQFADARQDEACWYITGYLASDTFIGNMCQYGFRAAYFADGPEAYADDIVLMDNPATGWPRGNLPLFRNRTTQNRLLQWEVLHYLPGSPWSTDAVSYCCGRPTNYVPNPGSPGF